MKRILVFVTVILFAAVLGLSCNTVKKTLSPVKDHKPVIIILWWKPATLDTTKMDEKNQNTKKKYMVESNLVSGKFSLTYVNTLWAFKIMRLKWLPNTTDGYYLGYAFTSDDLGRASIMTDKDLKAAVKSGMYDQQQLELLKRHWNERKYELFSQLSVYPVKGKFDMASRTITPLLDDNGNLVFDTEVLGKSTDPKGKQSNNPFEGLGH